MLWCVYYSKSITSLNGVSLTCKRKLRFVLFPEAWKKQNSIWTWMPARNQLEYHICWKTLWSKVSYIPSCCPNTTASISNFDALHTQKKYKFQYKILSLEFFLPVWATDNKAVLNVSCNSFVHWIESTHKPRPFYDVITAPPTNKSLHSILMTQCKALQWEDWFSHTDQ